MWGNSRCLLWEPYGTHRYTVWTECLSDTPEAGGTQSNHYTVSICTTLCIDQYLHNARPSKASLCSEVLKQLLPIMNVVMIRLLTSADRDVVMTFPSWLIKYVGWRFLHYWLNFHREPRALHECLTVSKHAFTMKIVYYDICTYQSASRCFV
jgi:hypothetical protein